MTIDLLVWRDYLALGYDVRAGQPVPFCLTILRNGRKLDRLSAQARAAAQAYLDTFLTNARIVRTERGYVYYELPKIGGAK